MSFVRQWIKIKEKPSSYGYFILKRNKIWCQKCIGSKKKGIGTKVLFLCFYILITVVFDIYLGLVKYCEKIVMAITFPNDWDTKIQNIQHYNTHYYLFYDMIVNTSFNETSINIYKSLKSLIFSNVHYSLEQLKC